jgi:hypothetical protein
MAKELQFYGDETTDSGLTVVAKIFDNNGSQVGSDISCPEVGSSAIYIGNMPSIAQGFYTVRFKSGTDLLGQGIIEWNGTEEVTFSGQKTDEIHKVHGLDADNPMTVTPTQRTSGPVSQNISGDGATTSTVTRV